MLLLDGLIARREDFKETWIPNDGRVMQEWASYFKVGMYGAILECLGWWNLHICFLFSGYLGVVEIATQVVIMQIKNFTSLIPSGIAFAASGLVGNCIGMNQVPRAKSYADAAIRFSVVLTILILSIFTIYADQVASIFTTDVHIATATKDCFWSLFLYIFFSTVKGV